MLDPIEDEGEAWAPRLSMGRRKSLAFIEDELDPFRSSQHFEGTRHGLVHSTGSPLSGWVIHAMVSALPVSDGGPPMAGSISGMDHVHLGYSTGALSCQTQRLMPRFMEGRRGSRGCAG